MHWSPAGPSEMPVWRDRVQWISALGPAPPCPPRMRQDHVLVQVPHGLERRSISPYRTVRKTEGGTAVPAQLQESERGC